MKRPRINSMVGAAIVALNLAAYGRIVWLQRQHGLPLIGQPLAQTIALCLLASVAFLAAIVWVEWRGGLSRKWIWAAALLFRLVFLFARPALSDDVYRYIWDGQLAELGLSPYAYTVDAPELDNLDIPQRQLVNHPWMASPYPPTSQLLFHFLAIAFPPDPLPFQLAMILFDLCAALLLSRLLVLASLPKHRLLIYLWNPLVILELAYNAHIDGWMILLSLAAVYLSLSPSKSLLQRAVQHSRFVIPKPPFLAPFFLALATLTKFLPALLLPVLFWRWSWRQRLFYVFATLAILLPSGLIAGWGLDPRSDKTGLFAAVGIYLDRWQFNSGPFHWLVNAVRLTGFDFSLAGAKLLVGGIMIATLLTLLMLARNQSMARRTTRLLIVPFAIYILLTPTVHPWYALILVAFLPFLAPARDEPRRLWLWLLPWLYLGALLPLSYAAYIDPANQGEREWIRLLEWVPTLLLLLFAAAWKRLDHLLPVRRKREGLRGVINM